MQLSKPDYQEAYSDKKKREQKDFVDLKCLFDLMVTDDSGCLSMDEFVAAMQNERVVHAMCSHGVDIKAPELYFKTLPVESSLDDPTKDAVSVDDLARHVIKVKGAASSIDVKSLA